ncbi:hypothetical protein N7478_001045 [Penicillium angulare]|uniref:uncharacterized protein n=1 Tax=Penicillium angulare TaxID=116970 RepID=UPI00253F87CB|nr:uncharacterized protein N7478_001045 [Penicillium angulare]KAJ5291794.1 hypothetical protein N7478_001045 [Penicillium angulare]
MTLALGTFFATNFTLGGELTSSRMFREKEQAKLEATQESIKTSAGLSITSPYASAGGGYAKWDWKETTEGVNKVNQSLRLAWEARGEVGQHLETPAASGRVDKLPGDRKRIWTRLLEILKNLEKYPAGKKIVEFYESENFKIEDYNSSLSDDEAELKFKTKVKWGLLSLEQQTYVGLLAYDKKFVEF